MKKPKKAFQSRVRYLKVGLDRGQLVVQLSSGGAGNGDRIWAHLSREQGLQLGEAIESLLSAAPGTEAADRFHSFDGYPAPKKGGGE